jgi:putative transposase
MQSDVHPAPIPYRGHPTRGLYRPFKEAVGRLLHPLRTERPNHVWSYDFVADRTHDGKAFRMLCIIEESSRESLAIHVARKLKATNVIEALCELFVLRGIPPHIRSDNGPEFVAEALRDWIAPVGALVNHDGASSPPS